MPNQEILTRDLVCQAVDDGKRVFVPYLHRQKDAKSKVMDMLELRSLGDLESLERDAWGIPTLTHESVANRRNALGGHGVVEDHKTKNERSPVLDLMLIPGLAFDRCGGRLGQGKGFYDDYLKKYSAVVDRPGEGARLPHLGTTLLFPPCIALLMAKLSGPRIEATDPAR